MPSSETTRHERSPLRRRMRMMAWLTLVATLLSVGALVGAAWAKSPQQRAAEEKPPPPSVLTAPVVSKSLTRVVTVRGEVHPALTLGLPLAPASPGGAQHAVVTAVGKRAGEKASPGELLMAVNGRPVVLLKGAAPGFRDLVFGLSGADVKQGQEALVSLGCLDASRVSSTFDAATQDGVSCLYDKVGVAPVSGSDLKPELATQLRAAQRALRVAQAAVDDAQTGPAAALARAVVERDVAAAEVAELAAAAGVVWPLAEQAWTTSEMTQVLTSPTVGDVVGTTPVMQLAVGTPTVEAVVPAGSAGGVKPEMKARVFDDAGTSVPGSVVSLGAYQPAASGTNVAPREAGHPLKVALEGASGQWYGARVRVDIETESTPAPVLVVPLTAVRADADGTAWVSVLQSDGQRRRVEVSLGVQVGGEAAVRGGGIAAGDKVVISG